MPYGWYRRGIAAKGWTYKQSPAEKAYFGKNLFAKKAVQQVARKVMRREVEKKHVQLQNNLVYVSNAGDLFHVNRVGLGANDYQRIGNKVKMVRLGIRGCLLPSTENVLTDIYNDVRMLVIYDKQANGAAPILGQILTYPTDVNSPRNPDYTDRYTTLADRSFLVYNKAGQFYSGNRFRINIKKTLPTQFGGDGNTIADITHGSIYVIFLSDSVAPDHPFVKYNTAYTYMDA